MILGTRYLVQGNKMHSIKGEMEAEKTKRTGTMIAMIAQILKWEKTNKRLPDKQFVF